MAIQRLSPNLINQIAAGEVIERPASVLKELLENSLDAGATHIKIKLQQAGQSLLALTDNGRGITREDLPLALERHATSKLPHEDLWAIRTFGFRGEALPSIGSVSRLRIISRPHDQPQAWSLGVEGGVLSPPKPVSAHPGTHIEVSDLFFATPARLKFLKSERSELLAIRGLLDQLALAHPAVSLELQDEKRTLVTYPVSNPALPWEELIKSRLSQIIGPDFSQEAQHLEVTHQGYHLRGFLGLPTAHTGTSQKQFLYVNGRPVRDKMLSSLIKIAYQDTLPPGRFPQIVLFVDVPLNQLDVNVHPAKTEVRFAEIPLVKEFVLDTLKRSLRAPGVPATQRVSQKALQLLHNSSMIPDLRPQPFSSTKMPPQSEVVPRPVQPPPTSPDPSSLTEIFPLGHALGQVHNSYIVAQNAEGFVIVDQHAAHERLVYEKMKRSLSDPKPFPSEALLVPCLIPLSAHTLSLFEPHQPLFQRLGLDVQALSESTLCLRSVPSLLKGTDWSAFFNEFAEHLIASERDGTAPTPLLEELLCETLATQSCKSHSIKAGRPLSLLEMETLLRDMEKTPNAAQCNHGRPTYLQLTRKQLDRLFGR